MAEPSPKIDALIPELIAAVAILLPPANACVMAAACKRWAECVHLRRAMTAIKAKYFLPEKTALAIARRFASKDSAFRWSIQTVPATPFAFGRFNIVDVRLMTYAWKSIRHSKRFNGVYLTGATNRFVNDTTRVSAEVRIAMLTASSGTITLAWGTDSVATRFRHCSAADALRACGVRVTM